MKVFQIGSSICNPDTANDLDLIVVSDKPVDICLYTTADWEMFLANGGSSRGQRVVLHPRKHKGSKNPDKPLIEGPMKQILGS